ncbi:MAG TPA: VOC family protein [Caulobacter sp.]|nr:VOC family protein [Caulobacter sp.]
MRLNQVTASARDLAASIAFYEALGLRLIVRNDHYARFECPDADGGEPPTFSLHLDPETAGVTRTVIYFEDDDLDATVNRLKAGGLAFDSDPADQSWLWREARLRDPAGNAVCLYRAGRIRRFPPWRLA